MAEIGKRIKYLRKTKDMSQKDLAEKLHVAVSTISNWETGRNNVSSEFFDDLASAFKVNISDLINDEEKIQNRGLPLAMSSKPYLDYKYSFNYVYWSILLLTLIFTFLSPIFKGLVEDLSILLWIIFILLSIGVGIVNYKKNISTKYFEDGQSLYYEHKRYTSDAVKQKKSLRWTYAYSIPIVNILLIFSAAIIFAHTDDLFTYIFYPLVFVLINFLMVYSLIIQANELRRGKTMSYESINLNFFLSRIKMILILYLMIYFYHYLVVYTLEINPYTDFFMVLFHVCFLFFIIVLVDLYQEEKFYYSLLRIKVK